MDLLAALAATWPPAAITRLGPWTLRRGAGGGSRVSAATRDGPRDDPAPAEAAMRGWDQRPLFMIRPAVRPDDEALDAHLAARGYLARDASLLLVGPTAELAAGGGLCTIPCEAPLACMVETWAAGGVGAARLAVMARAAPPRTWLLGRLGDRPVGCGFVALHGPVAMLHALEIAGFARRQGLGRRMTRAAALWSAARGATTLALAVTRANAPALALYAGLGMTEAGAYHYRAAPVENGWDSPPG